MVKKETLASDSKVENCENLTDSNQLESILSLLEWIVKNDANPESLEMIQKTIEDKFSEIDDIAQYSDRLNQLRNQISDLSQPNSVSDLVETNPETKIKSITPAGIDYLKPIVTNSDSNVYAFKDSYSPITIAASMARLSRRGDDLRITLLEEFSDSELAKDESLLKRVISAYGDDSVQQLAGQHVVVEGASNLLTKKLEWGRLASYLEQSTRYIFFDQKDQSGAYKYVTPPEVLKDDRLADFYQNICDRLFVNYSELVRALTDYSRTVNPKPQNRGEVIAWQNATRAAACDVARNILPVATKSTVGIFASGQALEYLIMRLLSDDLAEAQQTGQAILNESRQTMGVFLERADLPDRGGAYSMYQAQTRQSLRKIIKEYPELQPASDVSEEEKSEIIHPFAELMNYNYPNELDLVADMLYDQTHLSLEDLRILIDQWTVGAKLEVFQAYIGDRLNRRHKPGRALEKIHYEWDIVSDYGIFRDLQRHRMIEDLTWQTLTPQTVSFENYPIPDLVDKTNFQSLWQQSFQLSERLFNVLLEETSDQVAQYATLLGHYMRWKMSYNARQAFHIHELRTTPQGHPSYRRLVNQMHEQISKIHPLIGEAMKFVNQDEDPALARLAAERYQQYKLNQLTNN
ncbi:MAG: FAD-dependent thymidylate synthase [Candidatus Saccharibacteria bacterium]|nr:FAD-dependent thymidylate synthase [Candidatus Saccharibacteria bacterium]